jgi:hypothetical protein
MSDRGPDVLPLGGGQILIRRWAVVVVWRALATTVATAQRRDAVNPSPELQQLLATLATEAAAVSRAGQSAEAELARWGADAVSTREAAAMLGTSPRTVRRMAPELGGVMVGGRLHFDRLALAAALADRLAA